MRPFTDFRARYGVALVFSAAALALRGALQPQLGEAAPLIALLLAPMLSAYFGGLGPGLLATVVTGFAGEALFVPPYRPFPVGERETVRFLIFLTEGVLVSFLVDSRQRGWTEARRQRDEIVAAHAATAARERRFLATLEAALSGIVITDDAGRIVFVNRKTQDLFGYRRDELIGQPVEMLVPDRLRGSHVDERSAYLSNPVSRPMAVDRELTGRRKDGTEFPAEIFLNPFQDENERLVLSVVTDISERRRRDSERQRLLDDLARERERLAMALEAGGMGFWHWDPQTNQSVWNEKEFELLGVTPTPGGKVDTALFFEKVLPEFRGPMERKLSEKLRTGGEFSWEFAVDHPGKGLRWLMAQGRIVGPPEARRVLGLNWDITARKLRDQVNEEQARLLDLSRDAIVVRDKGDRITYWNDGAVETYGFSRQEAVGQVMHDLVQTQFPEPLSAIREKLERDRRWTGELVHTTRDGRRIDVMSRWLVLPGAGAERTVILETNSDITERKQAEDEVRRLNVELEARVEARTRELQSANEALEAFGHTIAHDLRAPLRNMQGFARALLEDYADRLDREGQMFAERIAAGAERMDLLIRDLLAYARLSRAELRYEPVYPEQAVRGVLDDMESEIERRGAEIDVQPDIPPVMAHRATLAAIFQNLISNAIKFTEPDKTPQITVRAVRSNGRVRLWVEDRGIGIDERHQQRIFEVFERLHGQEAYPGTGIGLAIVQKGADRMGGAAGVESTAGGGSRFWVELPAA